MSLRKGISTGLTTIVLGTSLVAAANGSCERITPYPLNDFIYDTAPYLGIAGAALLLGGLLGTLKGIILYEKDTKD